MSELNARFINHLESGGTVLTATRRQARIIRRLYDQAQVSKGRRCWPSADAGPVDAWLGARWREAAERNRDLPLLLTEGQATWWWRREAEGRIDPELVPTADLAGAARRAGSIGGILCLIRPTNAIIALLPLWEIAAAFRQQRERRGALLRGAASGLLAAVLVFSPQFTMCKGTGGKFLSGPYQEIGDYFDWLHPDFWGTLFATAQHGLFAWTPLLLPAAMGLAFFVKKDRRFGLLAILSCVLLAYIYSCWSVWWTGIGFSNRFFVELSPLLVLGLAALMEKAMQKVLSRGAVVVICSLFVVWNLFLIGEYRANIVPYSIPDPARVIDKPLTMGTIIYNHLFVFPQKAGTLFTSQWSNETFVRPTWSACGCRKSGFTALLRSCGRRMTSILMASSVTAGSTRFSYSERRLGGSSRAARIPSSGLGVGRVRVHGRQCDERCSDQSRRRYGPIGSAVGDGHRQRQRGQDGR